MRLIIVTTFLLASLSAVANESKDATASTDSALTPITVSSAPAAVAEDVVSPTESKKESEIPLNLSSPKKASDEGHPAFKLILIISMMGLVGTGAYIYLRKYSKTNFAAGKNNEIKVLTQHYLGPKKSLAIIRVAGESILIGVTDQNINMIKSLALLDDEVPEEIPNSNFADLFGGVPVTNNMSKAEEEDEDEFSIRGVKEVVSKKLKGMRSFQ